MRCFEGHRVVSQQHRFTLEVDSYFAVWLKAALPHREGPVYVSV